MTIYVCIIYLSNAVITIKYYFQLNFQLINNKKAFSTINTGSFPTFSNKIINVLKCPFFIQNAAIKSLKINILYCCMFLIIYILLKKKKHGSLEYVSTFLWHFFLDMLFQFLLVLVFMFTAERFNRYWVIPIHNCSHCNFASNRSH